MQTNARAAAFCAAVVIALTGGVALPCAAQASVPAGLAPAGLTGVCGTLIGTGLSVAGFARAAVARGAGWVGLVVSAGCLVMDADEAARAYNLSPEGVARFRALQARYRGYGPDDFMREFGCTETAVPPVAPDDVSTYGRVTWDCTHSPYSRVE